MKLEADLGPLVPVLEKFAANQETALKMEAEVLTSLLKTFNDGVSAIKTYADKEWTRREQREARNAEYDSAKRELDTLELKLRNFELKKKLEVVNKAADEASKQAIEEIAKLKAQAAIDAAKAEALKAANKLAEEQAASDIIEAKKKELISRLPKMDPYELER